MASAGFEDRSLGAWVNLLRVGVPREVILLEYREPSAANKRHAILIQEMLLKAGVGVRVVPVSSAISADEAGAVLASGTAGQTIIDITSMTKPLIYWFVKTALKTSQTCTILHTGAAHYAPSEIQLDSVKQRLMSGRYAEGFEELDVAVAGEKGPYICVDVDERSIDPSRVSFLALFCSLKDGPIQAILGEGPVEAVTTLYAMHSAGEGSARSIIAKYLAEHYSQVYGGESIGVASVDHRDALRELKKLYVSMALAQGANFEVALSGTKMHAVATGMLASIAKCGRVLYPRPSGFLPTEFTTGTGPTQIVRVHRIEETRS